jgi:hypothetical protein
MEIDGSLGIEPEVGGCSKRCPEFEGHLGGHRGPCVHNAIDDSYIASDVGGELLLCHVERLEKLLPQNLTGSRWLSLVIHALSSSIGQRRLVVVDDIDIFGVTGRGALYLIRQGEERVKQDPLFAALMLEGQSRPT